ncbi:MAG: hypothetical protein WCC64_12740 [Aliidongia sp.]
MTGSAFDKIREGLEDALAYAQGDTSWATTHNVEVSVPDVKTMRQRLGMSQDVFARAIKISPAPLLPCWRSSTVNPKPRCAR